MTGPKLVGYRRVSTVDQKADRQLDDLITADLVDPVFTDKASGKDTSRPKLAEALRYVRPGETLVVHSMDRLARNLDDLRRIVKVLTVGGEIQIGDELVACKGGARVQFVKEGLTFTGDDSPMNTLLLSLLGAVAEFERSLILERQREGIALAKKAGKYRGSAPKLNDAQIAELARRKAAGEGVAALARDLGVSRATVYRAVERAGTSQQAAGSSAAATA